MKLQEILTLAKAGYKRKDIEAMENEPEPEPEPEPTPAPQPEPEPEPEPDYKALYEQTKAQLENAQKQNLQQPMAEPIDAEKEFQNFIDNFN